MRITRSARLSCAALAGLTLVAAALAGSATVVRAGAGSSAAAKPGGIISTIAGGPGGPGPATSYTLNPCDVHYADGYVYIGDAGFVRRVSVATGVLTTVAGNGASGPTASGGPATGTDIGFLSNTLEPLGFGACGTAVDASGNLVIAANATVWVLAAKTGTFYGQKMTAGDIYSVESTGSATGVAVDRAGNLVITDAGWGQCGDGGTIPCDYQGASVAVLAAKTGTFYGQKMTAGQTYSIAGVTNPGPTGDGGPATQAWLGTDIGQVQVDRAGNILVATSEPCCLYYAYPYAPWPLGTLTVIAGASGTFYGQKMTAGDIYTLVSDDSGGVAIDHAGNLVIGDDSQVRVLAVRTGTFYGQKMIAGHTYNLAGVPGYPGSFGDGGPAARAKVSANGITIDAAGNVVFTNEGNRVRVIAERSGTFYGRPMKAGYIYAAAGNGTTQWLSGWGALAPSAQIGSPTAISADRAGDVVTSSGGTALVVPAMTGTFFGRHMTGADLYILTRNGCTADNCMAFDGDNALIGGSPVRLIPVRNGRYFGRVMTAGDSYAIGPSATAVGADHHGNALLVDGNRVKVIAASTGTFYGRTMYAGETYAVAGDGNATFNGNGELATEAALLPNAVAVDAAGNLIVTDGNARVRVVAVKTGTFYGQKMTAGHIYVIAGGGTRVPGDGGRATSASIGPTSVAVSPAGALLLADTADSRLRSVSP